MISLGLCVWEDRLQQTKKVSQAEVWKREPKVLASLRGATTLQNNTLRQENGSWLDLSWCCLVLLARARYSDDCYTTKQIV